MQVKIDSLFSSNKGRLKLSNCLEIKIDCLAPKCRAPTAGDNFMVGKNLF